MEGSPPRRSMSFWFRRALPDGEVTDREAMINSLLQVPRVGEEHDVNRSQVPGFCVSSPSELGKNPEHGDQSGCDGATASATLPRAPLTRRRPPRHSFPLARLRRFRTPVARAHFPRSPTVQHRPPGHPAQVRDHPEPAGFCPTTRSQRQGPVRRQSRDWLRTFGSACALMLRFGWEPPSQPSSAWAKPTLEGEWPWFSRSN